MEQIVYRIEHPKNRVGPYRYDHVNPIHCEWQRLMAVEHTNEGDFGGGDHPGGWQDFCDDDFLIEDNVFGFHSLEDLMNWFDGWLEYLIEMGFVVRSYIVPGKHVTYGKSNKQIMFNQKHAKLEYTIFQTINDLKCKKERLLQCQRFM